MSLRHKTTGVDTEDIESPISPANVEEKKDAAVVPTPHNPIEEYLDVVQDPTKRTKLAKKVRRRFIENRLIFQICACLGVLAILALVLYLSGYMSPKYNPQLFTLEGVCLNGNGNALSPTPGTQRVSSYNYAYRGKLTPEYFYKNYIQTNTPLVIKNSLKDSIAFKNWSSDKYLAEKYGSTHIDYEKLKDELAGKFTHKKLRKTMQQFLDIYKDVETGYAYHLDTEISKYRTFGNDFDLPEYIPCSQVTPYFVEYRLEMGNGGQRTILHNTDYETVYYVLDGHKRVTLFPPSQAQYLYEQREAQDFRTSPVNLLKPDFKKHPRFRLAEAPYEVLLEAGDVLYIPAYWYHQVQSTCRHISLDLRFDLHDTKHMHIELERRGIRQDSAAMQRMAMDTESACENVAEWDKASGMVQMKRDSKRKKIDMPEYHKPVLPKETKKIIVQQKRVTGKNSHEVHDADSFVKKVEEVLAYERAREAEMPDYHKPVEVLLKERTKGKKVTKVPTKPTRKITKKVTTTTTTAKPTRKTTTTTTVKPTRKTTTTTTTTTVKPTKPTRKTTTTTTKAPTTTTTKVSTTTTTTTKAPTTTTTTKAPTTTTTTTTAKPQAIPPIAVTDEKTKKEKAKEMEDMIKKVEAMIEAKKKEALNK